MPQIDQSAEASTTYSPSMLQGSYIDPEVDRNRYPYHLAISSPATTFLYRVVKRSFDITFALLALPVFLIVGTLIAASIYLNSPGPVMFSHRRIRRGGKLFRMWKFRTMCLDASKVLEEYLEVHPESRTEWALTHKLKKDPRVSAVGLFLRRTSLDEIPQILNILSGTMSFVGPRPIVTAEVQKYGQDFRYYTAVKPGLTGLWQTSGRSSLSYAQRVALDRFYVENWSLWLELKILFRTIRTVIKLDGAY